MFVEVTVKLFEQKKNEYFDSDKTKHKKGKK